MTPDRELDAEVADMRRELSLTQQQLADLLGVSRVSVAGWESGKVTPRPNNLNHMRALVSQHRIRVGLRLQRVHRCYCYDAGYAAGQVSAVSQPSALSDAASPESSSGL